MIFRGRAIYALVYVKCTEAWKIMSAPIAQALWVLRAEIIHKGKHHSLNLYTADYHLCQYVVAKFKRKFVISFYSCILVCVSSVLSQNIWYKNHNWLRKVLVRFGFYWGTLLRCLFQPGLTTCLLIELLCPTLKATINLKWEKYLVKFVFKGTNKWYQEQRSPWA